LSSLFSLSTASQLLEVTLQLAELMCDNIYNSQQKKCGHMKYYIRFEAFMAAERNEVLYV
jgi:hypothetical protein